MADQSVKDQNNCVEGVDFLTVPVGDGLIAWVSPIDADIARIGWRAKKSGRKPFIYYYAVHGYRIGEQRGEYYLHNLVWEKAHETKLPDGFLVDHINQDKLDNRRENLRMATRRDNEANKRKRRTQSGKRTTSKYKGVSRLRQKLKDGTIVDQNRNNPWRATITYDGVQRPLGCFPTEEEAARAYDKAAYDEFGEFAYLNFPKEHGHEQSDS